MSRFLSRLILCFCCVAAAIPASAQPPSVAESTAIAALEKLGARCQYGRVPGKEKQDLVIAIDPHNLCKVTDADLKWLKDISGVTELRLQSKVISDEGLKHLKDMPPGLASLYLECDNISDDGLKYLKDIPPGLVSLRLAGSDKISDTGLKYLKDLKQLRGLVLLCAKLTDRGMTTLGSLKQLRWLDLYAPLLTDVGLKELHALSNLESLRITHCYLSDAALLQFKKSLSRLKDSSEKNPTFNDPLGAFTPNLGAFTVQKLPRLINVGLLAVSPKDDADTRLVKLKFNTAHEAFGLRYRAYLSGRHMLEHQSMLKVLGGMIDATQELADFPERAAVLDGVADVVQVVRLVLDARVDTGSLHTVDAAEMRYDILTLELRILRAKQAKGKPK